MAITTLAGIRSGLVPTFFITKGLNNPTMAGQNLQSFWGAQLGGFPTNGAFDNTLNGVVLTTPLTGAIPYTNPLSGNSYLARFQINGTRTQAFMLCDRLWHNGNYDITSTSAQNSTTPTWPARDENGATAGAGVLLGLEISAATGAGTPTITVSYTNSAGTSGRTATNIIPAVATSGIGNFYLLSLQAGDVGVKSVESLTLNATWTSGTMNLVAFRPLCWLPQPTPGTAVGADAITAAMPRIYDSSVLFVLGSIAATNATLLLSGEVQIAQG